VVLVRLEFTDVPSPVLTDEERVVWLTETPPLSVPEVEYAERLVEVAVLLPDE
jgi:hypothetical protein